MTDHGRNGFITLWQSELLVDIRFVFDYYNVSMFAQSFDSSPSFCGFSRTRTSKNAKSTE